MEKRRFQNWWFLGINGIVAVVFGLLMLLFSQDFIKTVILYFGIIILVTGIILLFAGIVNVRKDRSAAMLIFESIIAIAAGIVLTFFPQSSFELFISMVGVWLVVTAIVQLVFLFRSKGVIARKNLFIVNSLLVLVLGILLFFNPYTWGVFIVKLLGLVTTLLGILLIWFSLILRSVKVKEVIVGEQGTVKDL